MNVVVLSVFANNDLVDYVASFFEREKHEVIKLGYKLKGISYRESENLCHIDELKEVVKDAALIVIARNENQIKAINSEGNLVQRFNELLQNKVVVSFTNSELESRNKRSTQFNLSNYKQAFSKTEGITDTGLYVKFIRRINTIKNNELAAYFPNDRFTCGIDPTRKFYGEEDGY